MQKREGGCVIVMMKACVIGMMITLRNGIGMVDSMTMTMHKNSFLIKMLMNLENDMSLMTREKTEPSM